MNATISCSKIYDLNNLPENIT
uniref:Uncharacterized protein n=1 Tax=Arundo donax TaxID=35708 RepID=A0A0A9FZU8_ARUDO